MAEFLEELFEMLLLVTLKAGFKLIHAVVYILLTVNWEISLSATLDSHFRRKGVLRDLNL
jgi:hypothetical protein